MRRTPVKQPAYRTDLPRLRAGAPLLVAPREGAAVTISTRIGPDEARALKVWATKDETSVADLVRKLVREALEREQTT